MGKQQQVSDDVQSALMDLLKALGLEVQPIQQPEPKARARRSAPTATPKAAPKPKTAWERGSIEVSDSSEPKKGVTVSVDFVLDSPYFLADGEQIKWLRNSGMDIPLYGAHLPSMSDVVAHIRHINGVERGEGSNLRYWARFRMQGSRTRLTSHQVRWILANGSLRNYKKPSAQR